MVAFSFYELTNLRLSLLFVKKCIVKITLVARSLRYRKTAQRQATLQGSCRFVLGVQASKVRANKYDPIPSPDQAIVAFRGVLASALTKLGRTNSDSNRFLLR